VKAYEDGISLPHIILAITKFNSWLLTGVRIKHILCTLWPRSCLPAGSEPQSKNKGPCRLASMATPRQEHRVTEFSLSGSSVFLSSRVSKLKMRYFSEFRVYFFRIYLSRQVAGLSFGSWFFDLLRNVSLLFSCNIQLHSITESKC